MELIEGVCQVNRVVPDVEGLRRKYLDDVGLRYLGYRPSTPRDALVPEDLAVTILINSRVGWRAFASVQEFGATVDLSGLTDKPLEQTTDLERQALAELIASITSWSGLAASVATKVLHKKRPSPIPILDNWEIFGAYLNPSWPKQRSWSYSVYDAPTIRKALDWITAVLLQNPARSGRVRLADARGADLPRSG